MALYKVGEVLREEMRQVRAQDKLEFLSANTGIPETVLNTIIDKGQVSEEWLKFKFLRDAVTHQLVTMKINNQVNFVWREL